MIEIAVYGVLGIAGLLIGGTILIPGCVSLAKHLNVSAAVIAVIVIAGGTSAPELLVSIDAALLGSAGIVWGNLLGSNIANIFLVLGLGLLVQPVCADEAARRQLLAMGILTAAVWLICLYGGLIGLEGRLVSAGLVAGFIIYLFFLVRDPKKQTESSGTTVDLSVLKATVYALGGVGCLVAGADAFVWSGVTLARILGWPEVLIGMSIIAIGTSLPEIISVLASLMHRRSDIALGNVIGSNLFNISLVLGAAGLTAPLPTDKIVTSVLMPVLGGATLILLLASYRKQPIGIRSGIVFIGFYLAFLGLQIGTYGD